MHSIHIHHFDAHYTVPRSLEEAALVQQRLDVVASNLLASVWEQHTAQQSEHSDTIYFIKRMEVDMTLDVSSGDDRMLAAIWAQALQQGIERTLRNRHNGIIVFQGRAEFVASWIGDLLRNRAWERWYYHEFEYLRSFSPGQAIVETLSTDGDVGRDALMVLTKSGNLDLLLATLTDSEVETVVARCLLPPGPRVILPNTIAIWVKSLRALLADPGLTLTNITSRDMARLYLSLLRIRPELGPDVHLARFILDLLQLRQTVIGLQDRHRFLASLEADEWMAVLSQLMDSQSSYAGCDLVSDGHRQGTPLHFTRQMNLDRLLGRGRAQQVLTTLLHAITGTETAALLRDLRVHTPHLTVSHVLTRYGGLFLLVPALIDLELHDFLQRCPYPEPEHMSKEAFLLFMLALQCLGVQHVAQTYQDNGLVLFAGLSLSPTSAQIKAYANRLTPELHRAFSALFQTHYAAVTRRHRAFILSRENVVKPGDNAHWFSLSPGDAQLLPGEEWDAALTEVSVAILYWFSSKLGAFVGSSPGYLYRNFLNSHAEIEVSAEHIVVHFLTSPLQVVLRLAGFDHTTWEVPWLAKRRVEFRFNAE